MHLLPLCAIAWLATGFVIADVSRRIWRRWSDTNPLLRFLFFPLTSDLDAMEGRLLTPIGFFIGSEEMPLPFYSSENDQVVYYILTTIFFWIVKITWVAWYALLSRTIFRGFIRRIIATLNARNS